MNKYAIKYTVLGLLLMISGFVYSAQPGFSIIPKVTSLTVNSGEIKIVSYTVVNNAPINLIANTIGNLPAGVTQTKGGCGSRFNLARGKACVFYLAINADKLKGSVQLRPKVCSMKSAYCSYPSTNGGLNIVKKPALTVLSASPQSFSFVSGGATQKVIIVNKGPYDAKDIKITRTKPSSTTIGITTKRETSLGRKEFRNEQTKEGVIKARLTGE